MRHGWLTTLRRDGSPRTSRVWFVEDADILWIATSESARKVADVRRDGRVSFAIEGRHDALRATAELRDIAAHPEVVRAFAEEYGGWDAADPGSWGPRVLLRLTVEG